MKIDPLVDRELRACALPWTLEGRRRHVLVRICGDVVTKLPSGYLNESGRAGKNVRAAIRKYVREHKPS